MIPSYLSPLANHLWQSSLFAGVAGLLTLALRKNRASVRYWLWLAASVKFLIPFSLLVSIGGQFDWRTAPSVTRTPLPVAMDQIVQPFAVTVSGPLLAAVPETRSAIPIVFLGVWLCGFAVSVFCWVRAWRHIRAAVRTASPLHVAVRRDSASIPVMCSRALLEPCVFGLVRPILLLPHGIEDRLTPQQLETILAHEFCHIRRRDNLTAAIHMVAETVFWFYPLVPWIGKRLIEEREHACDEEVLRITQDPESYAQGILNVCKLYLESSGTCAAGVTGSDLKRRVEAIMHDRIAVKLNGGKKALLVGAGIASVFLPLGIGLLKASSSAAQSQSAPHLQFEVASVKRNTSVSQSMRFPVPANGLFAVENIPLKVLISYAFGVQGADVAGAPAWVGSEKYDVTAKAAQPDVRRNDYSLMVQALLVDRFRLSAHSEERDRSGYTLIVDKTGPKLVAASAPCAEPGDRRDPGAVTCGTFFTGPASLDARKMSTPQFAATLSMVLNAPVIDKTGTTGVYDIHLEFNPEGTDLSGRGAHGLDTTPAADNPDTGKPSIFAALQQQLGLRLEPAKVPTNILIIDHIERPSEN
ncbi:MAG TPA: M56 family metallopeptidase [Terriglobia bacterium]|jgi:uncharacterized protein (TIGR03435 family)